MANKDLQDDYRACLENERGKAVLKDLAAFCYATKSTSVASTSEKQMLIHEGRRQVYLRIMGLLKIDMSDVYELEYDETI